MTLRHVVLFRLASTEDQAKDLAFACAALRRLPDRIDEIISLHADVNSVSAERNADLALIVDVADASALDAYLRHPAHREVIEATGHLFAERVAIDLQI